MDTNQLVLLLILFSPLIAGVLVLIIGKLGDERGEVERVDLQPGAAGADDLSVDRLSERACR